MLATPQAETVRQAALRQGEEVAALLEAAEGPPPQPPVAVVACSALTGGLESEIFLPSFAKRPF
jgi:hypothetical protein